MQKSDWDQLEEIIYKLQTIEIKWKDKEYSMRHVESAVCDLIKLLDELED